jgi:hypothetical protein
MALGIFGGMPDRLAVEAAIRVSARHGFVSAKPRLLQETNNAVVWMRPHEIVAKVGTRPHSAEGLSREHAIAVALALGGAPIAPPLQDVAPSVDDETGFLVTLWNRLHIDADDEVPAREAGLALDRLHQHLARFDGQLPDLRSKLEAARGALADNQVMTALPPNDRSMLRAAYDGLWASADSFEYERMALHGEPHDGNLLATPTGLKWIDLEGACLGPLEWDLAFLPEEAAKVFSSVDGDLLSTLRLLNSARVATWCWSRFDLPEMQWHARFHLDAVRKAWA